MSTLGFAESNVGRVFPSERREITDPKTGLPLIVLTSDPSNDAKPYQTHPTWTADGEWIIFRGTRGGSTPQAFLVNERTGAIIQLTDGPGNGLGSLNLSRKAMKLYLARGGRAWGPNVAPETPERPRQLIEIDLGKLIPDAL
ncbi:MAG TPA: hypothetical protein VHF69_07990, partial [Candidatus Synoicihabitans sp.]|nr:hypothetical protein [Candidatus Synoicihabitans sp.]